MANHEKPQIKKLALNAALGGVLLLWLLYTLLYSLNPDNRPTAFLEFIPGILALGLLRAAGFGWQDCFLHRARLSRAGLGLLAASFIFVPLMLATGRWTGGSWQGALVYAPAIGVSQELFFRAALLPILMAALKGRPNLALVLHALLFAAWHIPKPILAGAPAGGIIGIVAVTFICGLLWGRQVQRDGTVFWLMGYHSLVLIINSFFTWG